MDDDASLAALYLRTLAALDGYRRRLSDAEYDSLLVTLGAALVEAAELGRRAERAETATADEAVGV